MSLANLLNIELPLGRTLLLAWLTATFIHVKWGVAFTVLDVSPIEFIIQAGMLYGYFMVWSIVLRWGIGLLLPLILLIAINRLRGYSMLASISAASNSYTTSRSLLAFSWRLLEVAAMFGAFIFYSEFLLQQLAPIGLIIVLVLFVFGVFHTK